MVEQVVNKSVSWLNKMWITFFIHRFIQPFYSPQYCSTGSYVYYCTALIVVLVANTRVEYHSRRRDNFANCGSIEIICKWATSCKVVTSMLWRVPTLMQIKASLKFYGNQHWIVGASQLATRHVLDFRSVELQRNSNGSVISTGVLCSGKMRQLCNCKLHINL
jgi:hypothetical protein